jgi:quercetin dioxygenase-like cupin family protein
MPLYVRDEDIKVDTVTLPGNNRMSTKMIYGRDGSVMVATRPGGYHSRPHYHDSEQLNYVLDGEIWVFVDKEYFLVKAGDFYRVPASAVHWGWIRSDKPCTILEVHVPGLEAGKREHIVPLFADGEDHSNLNQVGNVFVPDDYAKEIEERMLAEEQRARKG